MDNVTQQDLDDLRSMLEGALQDLRSELMDEIENLKSDLDHIRNHVA